MLLTPYLKPALRVGNVMRVLLVRPIHLEMVMMMVGREDHPGYVDKTASQQEKRNRLNFDSLE